MKTKYVMMKNGIFAVFSEYCPLNHYFVCHALDSDTNLSSAGFIRYNPSDDGYELVTYGKSVSLSVRSDPKAANIITKVFENETVYLVRGGFNNEPQYATNKPTDSDERVSLADLVKMRIFEKK